MARNKTFPDFDTAVADIPDGAVIAIGGFAGPGTPYNLIAALARHGAKRLTCIANTTGGAHKPRMPDIGMLVENGQVAKVICAFTAATRASDVIPFTKYYEAGIPAFYTPTAVGTELAEGRETREINGRRYLLEYALPVDYAFIRAARADAAGNLRFHRSQRNFNPLMAMAAKTTIVEVEEDILPPGAIDADDVHTPGLVVHRLIRVPPPPLGLWTRKREAAR